MNKPYKTTFDLFKGWKTHCLKENHSLLFDNKNLWNKENLEQVIDGTLGDLRTDEGDFIPKLKDQFKNREIRFLLCDLLALHYCPDDGYDDNTACFQILDENNNYEKNFQKAVLISGTEALFSCGVDYKLLQWFSIGYYASLALKYKTDGEIKNLISDLSQGNARWDDAADILSNQNILGSKYSGEKYADRYTSHFAMLLHIFCGSKHTNILTKTDREQLIAHFSDKYLGANENDKTDNEKIYLINKAFKKDHPNAPTLKHSGGNLVDFYSDNLTVGWK